MTSSQPPRPLFDAIVNGDQTAARELADHFLKSGHDPLGVVNEMMIPAMDEVGRRFACSEFFVPELLMAGRAMKAALERVKPHLTRSGDAPLGRVAIGTVKGDLHDIGKNLVAAMLEWRGFEVIDLGVDVSPDRFVEAVTVKGATIIGLSSLLTTTMPSMVAVVERLREAGVRDRVKVMIGGAPVTERFAKEIGADGYGEHASAAVALARSFVEVSSDIKK